jgi:uncharacterized protein YbjT (DUF2867 family)
MKRILVTGATGNVGHEVVRSLCDLGLGSSVTVGARSIEKARSLFADRPELSYRHFDFDNQRLFSSAFDEIDVLFLLRPPHISKVDEYFRPLLKAAWDGGIRKIVFLSVQGAEKSKVIPHNQIEGLIRSFGFEYIMVRPSYFMQNLTTTLLPEIRQNRTITLPSGQAKFNWIDVKDIGKACAILIHTFEQHRHAELELTGTENRSFKEVTELLSKTLGQPVRFRNINPISFYLSKRKAGMESGFAVVMTILHFLPRFQKEPDISDNYKMLTGQEPTTLKTFVEREKQKFINQ